MLRTNKKLEGFAPENELNRKNYTRIIKEQSGEAEFELMRQKYGNDKVYLWVKQNQEKDNANR